MLWKVVVAAVVGFLIGLGGASLLVPGADYPWWFDVVFVVLCPSIFGALLNPLLVPVVNAALYAAIAWAFMRLRARYRISH